MKREICLIAVVSFIVSLPSALASPSTTSSLQSLAPTYQSPGVAPMPDLSFSSIAPATAPSVQKLAPPSPAIKKIKAEANAPAPALANVSGMEGMQTRPDFSAGYNPPNVFARDEAGPDGYVPLPSCNADDSDKDAARRSKEINKGLARYQAVQSVLAKTQASIDSAQGSKAVDVVTGLVKGDKMVSKKLNDAANCIAVIPSEITIKAILPFGIDYGAGMYTCERNADGTWDMADGHYIQLKGGSIGPQFGVKASDQVIYFSNPNAEEKLQKGSFQIGADAGVTVANFGRDLSGSLTNGNPTDPDASYSHSAGLYIGATIKGSKLGVDKAMEASMRCQTLPKPKNIFTMFIGLFHHNKAPKNDAGADDTDGDVASVQNKGDGRTIGLPASGSAPGVSAVPAVANSATAGESDDF